MFVFNLCAESASSRRQRLFVALPVRPRPRKRDQKKKITRLEAQQLQNVLFPHPLTTPCAIQWKKTNSQHEKSEHLLQVILQLLQRGLQLWHFLLQVAWRVTAAHTSGDASETVDRSPEYICEKKMRVCIFDCPCVCASMFFWLIGGLFVWNKLTTAFVAQQPWPTSPLCSSCRPSHLPIGLQLSDLWQEARLIASNPIRGPSSSFLQRFFSRGVTCEPEPNPDRSPVNRKGGNSQRI